MPLYVCLRAICQYRSWQRESDLRYDGPWFGYLTGDVHFDSLPESQLQHLCQYYYASIKQEPYFRKSRSPVGI